MAGNKKILHSLHHFLTAAILITKGIDKIGHHSVIGATLLLFGLTILVYFIYTLFQEQHNQRLEYVVRWCEGIVALLMAYLFYSEGKTFLPFVFLLSAIGFFISIYVYHKKARNSPPVH
jgi:hypothetical protein